MNPVPPIPEEQVLFLRNIQRLLSEGLFTASYKLALLHAIADLCVIKGDDSGGELVLDVKDRGVKRLKRASWAMENGLGDKFESEIWAEIASGVRPKWSKLMTIL